MKTAELSGVALDWAVAKCEGHEQTAPRVYQGFVIAPGANGTGEVFTPATNWAQGGPIIEREGLQLWKGRSWNAAYGNSVNPSDDEIFSGPTPLIAAMRCYVASKLGDKVKIPAELLEAA